jgi:hypothetical protein
MRRYNAVVAEVALSPAECMCRQVVCVGFGERFLPQQEPIGHQDSKALQGSRYGTQWPTDSRVVGFDRNVSSDEHGVLYW